MFLLCHESSTVVVKGIDTFAALIVALDHRDIADSGFSMSKKDTELCLSSAKSNNFHLNYTRSHILVVCNIIKGKCYPRRTNKPVEGIPVLLDKYGTVCKLSSCPKAFVHLL